MFKTLIFDLDGTLLDTSRDICRVLNDTLAHFSLPTLSLEKTVEYVGNGAKILIERAIPEYASNRLEEIYSYYAEKFASCDNALTRLYDGEEEALKGLKSRGFKLAVVTNKPQAATEGVYKRHLAAFGFDIVAGNTKEYPLKPDPTLTLSVAAQTGAKPCECLFIGDGETDVLTARNAGMKCASVLWGFRSREQLQKVGAENFVQSYPELFEFVLSDG